MKARRDKIRACGIMALFASHPEIRRLKRYHSPSAHGTRLWHSSWILMAYLERRPLPAGLRILDVGCGWGLLGSYCAKRQEALVTAMDRDPDVFPFLKLHARVNGVALSTLTKAFGGLLEAELQGFDVLVGADICFWESLVLPLKRLVNRALRAGVRQVLIADPGRAPFEELAGYYVRREQGLVLDWAARRPRPITGRILCIENDRDKTPRR